MEYPMLGANRTSGESDPKSSGSFSVIAVWMTIAWAVFSTFAHLYVNAPYYEEKIRAFGGFILRGLR